MRKGADEPGPLTAGAAGAADAEADEPAAGAALAALAAVGALGAEALELEADVALDAVEPPLSLGGSTATPPLPPLAAVAAVEPVEEPPLVAGALLVEPPAAPAPPVRRCWTNRSRTPARMLERTTWRATSQRA